MTAAPKEVVAVAVAGMKGGELAVSSVLGLFLVATATATAGVGTGSVAGVGATAMD